MKRIMILCVAVLTIFVLCSFYPKNNINVNNSYHLSDADEVFCAKTFDVTDENKENKSTLDIDAQLGEILERFKECVPDGMPADTSELSGTFGICEIFDYVASVFCSGKLILDLFLLLGVALLFCLAEQIGEDNTDISQSIRSASAIILSVPIFNIGKEIILSISESIASGSEFFSMIIPILCSVLALGAGELTAGTAGVGMNISLAFVSELLAENLLPMASLIFCVSILAGVDTSRGVSGVAKGIRWWFNFLIGFVSVIIVATLGVQSSISLSADSLALRSAKYALSGMIPIVGNTVSGSLSLLVSGVKYLSGSIGTISVIVILSFMADPLIKLLFYRFCLGACVTVTSFSGVSFAENFFSSIRGAVDCMIAVLSASLLVYITEIVILSVNLGNLG